MKRILALALALCMAFMAANAETVSTSADELQLTGDASKLKVGVILIGDENEGYTYAHILGIKTAAAKLGIQDNQIIWKYTIAEDSTCYDNAADLADSGCDVVFSNSYGHQTYMQEAAAEFEDVRFVSMTGDTAKKAGMSNFSNAFMRVYESRFVSGVVAGLKLKELNDAGKLTANNFDENGNVKVGYVGAYPSAEIVSGYTSFYLGVKSVFPNVSMMVQYTNSWFDINADYEAANMLLSSGCVILCQHADSTGAPSAVQAAFEAGVTCYCVGYNISMLSVAPDAALVSATSVWSVYYEYALKSAINGEDIATNWSAGYDKGAVDITELSASCAEGTAEIVADTVARLKSGALNVFDTGTFTVGGQVVTSAFATDTDGDWVNDADDAVWDGCYHESYFQSAPSFALRIDGITELNN